MRETGLWEDRTGFREQGFEVYLALTPFVAGRKMCQEQRVHTGIPSRFGSDGRRRVCGTIREAAILLRVRGFMNQQIRTLCQ